MNRNKVDKTWNEFSKLKNIELKFKERKQLNVIQSHYLINFTNEIATFSFIGILWKSTEGQTTDNTSIIAEYKNRLDINNFELETTNKLSSFFSIDNTTDFEKMILKDLKKFNGNSITLKDNFIRIDTNHIFSTVDEFEDVTDLISKIKNKGNNI